MSDTLRKNRDRALAAAAERAAAAAPDLPVDVDKLPGAPVHALVEAGSGASMLVVGARGIGAFTAMVLGSVSQYVSAHATCPVAVVREETTAAHRQVGVGIGDPARSAAALAFAFEEAELREASLIAVHAWDSPHGEIGRATWALATPGRPALEEEAARQLDSALADWQAKYPDVQVSRDFVHAHPGRALVGLSARADLVVIGRHDDARRPAWCRRGQARRPEPRARPRRDGPVVLIIRTSTRCAAWHLPRRVTERDD